MTLVSPVQSSSTDLSWRDHLPKVRGRYVFDAVMADQTWFRVGGTADVLFKPADTEDLIHFLANKPVDVPYITIGAGSNILVRDGGIRGIVIRLGRGFSTIDIKENMVEVGAGALDRTVALTCAEKGLGGLEFLVGVPGTIGGAVKMNAGCYGTEIKDVLQWADVLDDVGNVHRLSPSDLAMTYRHSAISDGQIVLRACFKCYPASPSDALQKIQTLLAEREEAQPVRGRTGGSTFRNPEALDGPSKAWQLIDLAQCRGLQIGDAQVSTKHCNFLLNLGSATAADLELLGNTVQSKVKQTTSVDLHWEIIRLGEK